MSDEIIPLDPGEGPTIWARQNESNRHTYDIIVGKDPENPIRTYQLSANEIKRLKQYVSNTKRNNTNNENY